MVFRKNDRQPAESPPPLFHGPEFCGLQVTRRTSFLVNWPSDIVLTLYGKMKIIKSSISRWKMFMSLSEGPRRFDLTPQAQSN